MYQIRYNSFPTNHLSFVASVANWVCLAQSLPPTGYRLLATALQLALFGVFVPPTDYSLPTTGYRL